MTQRAQNEPTSASCAQPLPLEETSKGGAPYSIMRSETPRVGWGLVCESVCMCVCGKASQFILIMCQGALQEAMLSESNLFHFW